MTLDPIWLSMLPSTMTVRELYGVNDYGEPSFSTAAKSYRCYVQAVQSLVNNFQGEETVATHTVYMASTSLQNATALFTLPDGSTPPLQRINTMVDDSPPFYTVISELSFGGGGGG